MRELAAEVSAYRQCGLCQGRKQTVFGVADHPAYLLRQPVEKRKAWQDLCLARAALVA
jgi:uracil-DNA glycosylase